MDSASNSTQLWEDPDTLSVTEAADADSGWMTLFFNAFRRSKNAMVLLDEQRRFVEVNGAALQLVGRPRAELIGRHVWEFVIGGPIVSEHEWQAALRQSKFTAVGDIRRGDGGRVTVECAGHPALVTARRLVLLVAMTTNRRGRQPREAAAASGDQTPLSPRELDIVRLIAAGASGTEIAEELQITHNTVRTHVRNSMKKLDTRSQAQLVARLLGEGLLWAEPSVA